jgi:hypothetical protein
VFEVLLEGRKVNNPQTNMPITLPGEKVGELKVVQSAGDSPQNEVSLCTLQQGNLNSYVDSKDFSKLFVREKGK